jgi:hypothetical protein
MDQCLRHGLRDCKECVPCKHGNRYFCGFCVAEKAPKCKHGNPFFCGLCQEEKKALK